MFTNAPNNALASEAACFDTFAPSYRQHFNATALVAGTYTKKAIEGAVIYRGPSLIDGAPIVVVATLTDSNGKTGEVLQTYILRADMDPRDASKTGADFAICGNCPHRGTPTDSPRSKVATARSCYVVIGQGPLNTFKSLARGSVYPTVNGHADIAALGRDRTVRLGTYGDPAAVPSYIWESLVSDARAHVGYTHQSGIDTADVRTDLCMTSADTLEDAQAAWSRGERTFRIVSDYADMSANEIACPADTRGLQCADCRLCGGTSVASPKSIAIAVHGAGARYF